MSITDNIKSGTVETALASVDIKNMKREGRDATKG